MYGVKKLYYVSECVIVEKVLDNMAGILICDPMDVFYLGQCVLIILIDLAHCPKIDHRSQIYL